MRREATDKYFYIIFNTFFLLEDIFFLKLHIKRLEMRTTEFKFP